MQTLLAWVKEFLHLVLILCFLEMLLPSSAGLKKFVKWLMTLVVLIFILQSLGGITNLEWPDWENWLGQTTYGSAEPIVVMGQRIAEGGEKPVLEALQRDFNQNLKSLLLVMDGVQDAEVVTQLGPQGEIQKVIATISTRDAMPGQVGTQNGAEVEVPLVDQVQIMPVAVGSETSSSLQMTNYGKATRQTEKQSSSSFLATKVRKFIATYYQIPEMAVRVVVY